MKSVNILDVIEHNGGPVEKGEWISVESHPTDHHMVVIDTDGDRFSVRAPELRWALQAAEQANQANMCAGTASKPIPWCQEEEEEEDDE